MEIATAKAIYRDLPQDTLEMYVKDRSEEIRNSLEICRTDDLRGLQGQLYELRQLLRAREYAEGKLNQARK